MLVLEAGSPVQGRYGNFATNASRALYRHVFSRTQQTQKKHPTYWNTNPDFFVDDVKNPYTTPEGKPFHWIRSRRLGGRTLTWDAVTPRFSDFEFKAASQDGLGPDWPITHAELAPYYAELETFFRVHGSREGIEALPDGEFIEPRPMTHPEAVFKERIEGKFRERKVIISRGIRAGRMPERGERERGSSSTATTLRVALQTGLLTIRTHSVVSRVTPPAGGKGPTTVTFIDSETHETSEVSAKLVFLCASTIETLRILLSSKSAEHPEGIGGASGVLGRYLMDHSAGNVYFYFPDVQESGGDSELSGCDSIMIPRYQNLGKQDRPYQRGFGLWGGIQRITAPSFLRKKRGLAFGFLCARSETLPHADNRVTLDPVVKDAWGVAAAHIDCEWKELDLQLAKGAREETHEMVEAIGAKVVRITDVFHTPFVTDFINGMQEEWMLSTPGMFVHEVGGARMGTSPKNSVVDSYGRCWDAPNVFVTDGACWPTSGWQNPTLTEMAITARACDHAIAELKRMNI